MPSQAKLPWKFEIESFVWYKIGQMMSIEEFGSSFPHAWLRRKKQRKKMKGKKMRKKEFFFILFGRVEKEKEKNEFFVYLDKK